MEGALLASPLFYVDLGKGLPSELMGLIQGNDGKPILWNFGQRLQVHPILTEYKGKESETYMPRALQYFENNGRRRA
jgi:hypothetical protein